MMEGRNTKMDSSTAEVSWKEKPAGWTKNRAAVTVVKFCFLKSLRKTFTQEGLTAFSYTAQGW